MERFLGALSITLLLTGLAAATQLQMPSNSLDRAVQAGLMTPQSNGTDGTSDINMVLSRAELASILVKAFHLDRQSFQSSSLQPSVAAIQLQDVPPSYWAYQDIQLVLQNGIMSGYREGRFYPDQRITRAEAFAIFAQAFGVFQFPEPTVSQVLAQYPDAVQIPRWARKPMATALREGFVNTKNDRIDPLSPMTRGDMAYALSVYLRQQDASTQNSALMQFVTQPYSERSYSERYTEQLSQQIRAISLPGRHKS
jgi:S-layer homology domain